MMNSEEDIESARGKGAGGENNKSLLLLSLEQEVLSLRKSQKQQAEVEASLLAELQRRCNKVIELEVHLDQERERANRLERERAEEEEALSGELRDIMANVNVSGGSAVDTTVAAPVGSINSNELAFDSAAVVGADDDEPELGTPGGLPSAKGSGGSMASASGIFSEWRLRRMQGDRANEGGVGVDRNGKVELLRETTMAEKWEDRKDLADGSGGAVNNAREQAAGALRARVVKLELQRAETEDLMREKTERSIRLEVQVEQLKNVVQSLSHASTREEVQGWGQGSAATVDLDPLLRDVPGVDPSVLLLLHRSPWADGVIEGVRKEEACFEWQGKDSRGEWSSRPGILPIELSSLPHQVVGSPTPPQPPPPTSLPQRRTQSPSSPSSSRSRSPTLALTDPRDCGVAEPEKGEDVRQARAREARAGPGGTGLRDKIEGAVTAVAAATAGRGLSGGVPGGRMVTDEDVTTRFDLDNVELPSDQWEWVGGWMVDSETEASSDQDGWIYGRSPSEISEIALGRKPSNIGNGEGISGELLNDMEEGDEVPPQQQQSHSSNRSDSDVFPASSAEGDVSKDTRDPQRHERESASVREGSGASGGGGGEGRSGGGTASSGDGWDPRLRRRRLVRLRVVKKVEGARDSTSGVLEMIRRLSSLEILVRKLSRQVVTQQRQVTSLESQVAFLAPLQPKLRMACALGRKDRMRGDALQGRLIEAENELKVLRRCMGSTSISTPRPAPPRSSFPRFTHSAAATPHRANAAQNVGAPGGQTPKGNDDVRHHSLLAQERDKGMNAGGSAVGGGIAAWGWVEGVAQRAAGTFVRRPRLPTPEAPENGVGGEHGGKVTFQADRGDAGTPI